MESSSSCSSNNSIADGHKVLAGNFYHGYPALKILVPLAQNFVLDCGLIMVRIKHRYLLIHILYPDPVIPNEKTPSNFPEKPPPNLVQFHRPSPNELTPELLVRTIRDQVLLLYGDYGLGLVSSGLKG